MSAPRPAAIAALVVACALALVLGRGAAPAPAATGSVLVVGDSLVVGTTPYLRRELAGVSVTSDGRIGRPSGEAVGVLRSKLGSQRIVVFDAGVNDDPSQPARLSADLASARSLAGGRCMVVATLSRPPYRGVTIDGLNRAVRSFAASSGNVRLVDWRAAATANRGLISPDGVHPTPAGYAFRARLFAAAIESCGSSAPPSNPPPSSGGLPPPGTPAPRGRKPRDRPAQPARPAQPRKPKPRPKPPTLGDGSSVLLDQPASIASDGARLSGELLAPAGGGRHPAVVMIQGSGPAVREQYREQGEYLASHGVAALIYDKRGAGESSGGPDPRYSQLAADVRAAVAYLRTRPEVDPAAIGLWGFSEGGAIAPMVAAGNPQVAAVMVVSPLVVASASQQEWRVRHALDASGAGSGAGPVSRYYAVAADAGGADLRFDPAQPWRRVAQPVLAAWGAADAVVPARASAERLRVALAGGGVNRDRTFRTFAGASHTLGVASESGRAGSAPGFMALSAQWLRAHLDPKRAAAPVVATPLPPDAPPEVHAVQSASLFERWPLQLAWLALPALALMVIAARAWRRRDEEDAPLPTALEWWWLGGVLALDALALLALAFAVASIVDVDGRGVAAVAGVPVVVAVTWVLVLAGAGATALLVKRARRRTPASGVCLASCAWLALALYWLV